MDECDQKHLERSIARQKAELLRNVADDLQAGRIKPDNMVQHLRVIAKRIEEESQ